ncbi:hypothetical protein, partial [Mesorhizobium sp.]|uniref:hypothetical protein n=1 Tax=Mesorhizobium sp. TaxID=1871066 RepID=UPI0025BB99F4
SPVEASISAMVEPILPAPTTTMFFFMINTPAISKLAAIIAACLSKGSVELCEAKCHFEQYADKDRRNDQ